MRLRPVGLFRRMKAEVAGMLCMLAGNAVLCRSCFFAVFFLLLCAKTDYISIPCPFYEVFHRPCPGCGLTRAYLETLAGNWAGMLRAHPFSPYLLLLGTLCLPGVFLTEKCRQRWAQMLADLENKTGFHTAVLLLFAGYGFLRMTGMVPFSV